jgi:hypothetical protein
VRGSTKEDHELSTLLHPPSHGHRKSELIHFSGKMKPQQGDEDSKVSDSSKEERIILDELEQSGIHLSKIESIVTSDNHRLWLCPGMATLSFTIC